MNRILSNKKAIGIFMIPGAIVYIFVVMIPVVWSVVYSFFEGAPGISFKFRGLSGYMQLFSDRQFRSSLVITLKYCVTVTAFQNAFGPGPGFFVHLWNQAVPDIGQDHHLPACSPAHRSRRAAIFKNL